MKSAIESTSTFDARLTPNGERHSRRTPLSLKLNARAAVIVAKLRELAPYALIELILPGGSVMAVLLWLYRRQRKIAIFAAHEIQTAIVKPIGARCLLPP